MGLTLTQLKTYTASVLKGWLTNKDILDKISESEAGNMLYNGKEIVGSSSSQTVVGKKKYPITATSVESITLSTSIAQSEDYGLQPNTSVTLSDSIENYDSISLVYSIKAGDIVALRKVAEEIPVDVVKESYGKSCFNIESGANLLNCGFIDATHIGSSFANLNTGCSIVIEQILGYKYETVSAEVVTDEQVTTAASETVTQLNTKEEVTG